MTNMTVRDFITAFVSRCSTIKILYFPETDTAAEVLYEGIVGHEEIPDDVRRRIVSSIVAVSSDLYIVVYKEDKQ